ncbi:MAG: hypothetical protein B7C24_02015 [Bacteroidetes bacterium 4572_77]|nr:MAG: hypothetical protein B7C24_02015 [Bacteroidetes bacterium 4572_77]
MKTYKILFLLIITIVMSSCGSKKDNSYESVEQLLSESQKGIEKITAEELKSILDHEGEYKIVDCREADEYIIGHIPGAVNVPRGVLEFSDKISNRRETIYIYSQTDKRATLACPTLVLLKYKRVYLVEGGWKLWNKSFPELIEEGDGEAAKSAPVEESGGGCG